MQHHRFSPQKRSIYITLGSLLIVAAVVATLLFFKKTSASASHEHILDVAIIGGGISGIYTAYRLSDETAKHTPIVKNILSERHESNLKLAIFEANDRLGGRILTVEIPNTDGLKTEMGPMRFMKSQKNVYGLITQALHLPIEDAGYMGHRNFHYLRDRKILYSDYKDHIENIPYQLLPSEQGKTPSQLYLAVIENVIPGILSFKSRQEMETMLQAATVADENGKEIPLYEWRIGDLLQQQLSAEGFNLLSDTYPFKSYTGSYDMSAYHAFYDNLHDYQVEGFIKLRDGVGALLTRLVDILKKRDVSIYTAHQLTDIQLATGFKSNDPIFELSILAKDMHGKAIEKKYYARQLVLTISPKAILTLNADSILFSDPSVRKQLDSLTSVPGRKLFFVYDSPWWEEKGYGKGRVETDLPLEQLYYFDSNEKAAILLAGYMDDPNNRLSADCDDISVSYKNKHAVPPTLWAPHCIVASAQETLKRIHSDSYLPEPNTALYIDWNDLPVGGAWHLWRAGVKPWEVIPRIRKPYPQWDIFIVGDTYVESSAWIESAINSAERMLTDQFKLDRAFWIPNEYEIGL